MVHLQFLKLMGFLGYLVLWIIPYQNYSQTDMSEFLALFYLYHSVKQKSSKHPTYSLSRLQML